MAEETPGETVIGERRCRADEREQHCEKAHEIRYGSFKREVNVMDSPRTMIASSVSGAVFSRCRRWRYLLWRRWGDGPAANFLMLNPSTADEIKLDPSCTRARNYAERWGFGAL